MVVILFTDFALLDFSIYQKQIVKKESPNVVWSFNNQTMGVQGVLLTLRNNLVAARALVSLEPTFAGSTDLIYEVYAKAPEGRVFGQFLFSGTMAKAPLTLDVNGNIEMSLVPPANASFFGSEGIVIVQGTKTNRRWGTGPLPALFEYA